MEAENADEAISLYLDSIKETVDNSQYDLNISVNKSEQTYEDKYYIYVIYAKEV